MTWTVEFGWPHLVVWSVVAVFTVRAAYLFGYENGRQWACDYFNAAVPKKDK